jgi:hypothetical protein
MWGNANGGAPLDARTAYEKLLTQHQCVTSALPRDQHGIDMLWDRSKILSTAEELLAWLRSPH